MKAFYKQLVTYRFYILAACSCVTLLWLKSARTEVFHITAISLFAGFIYLLNRYDQQKAKLEANDRLLNLLNDNLDVGVVLVRDNKIVHINKYLEKFFPNYGNDFLEFCGIFKPSHPWGNSKEKVLINTNLNNIKVYFEVKNIESSDNVSIYILYNVTEKYQNKNIIDCQSSKISEDSKMVSLGLLASGIGHEINTPLNVIQCETDEILELLETDQNVTENIYFCAKKINQMSERISKILKGLKTYIRNSEHDPFSKKSLRQIIESSLAIVESKLQEYNVEVLMSGSNKDLEVECRETDISQIILNLVNNSIDAISELENRWINIGIYNLGALVEIRVMDSGQGLTEEIKEKLFTPFFTTKDPGKGTGLGTSLSKKIARSHQGDLVIDERSENTCFVLRIPKIQGGLRDSA